MHIDAVLDFVVEYPLAWQKEIRIAYGSREGEVRWTQPDHPATLLRVISMLKNHSELNVDQEIEQMQQDYDGLEIEGKEQVTLPAGEAWHISGHTGHLALEAYLLSSTDRRYMITLTSAPEDVESHEEVMERVTSSFRFMQ